MQDFSVFEQVRGWHDLPQSDLGTISNLSRRDFVERETFFFRAQTPCIEYASLMIENALLLRTNRTSRIYAGFQKLSCMQPVIDRYLRIADVSGTIYVFGEADWQPPRHPNLRVIDLARGSRMTRELFLIADASTFQTALVAQDEDGFEHEEPDRRHYAAFKSSNAWIVGQLAVAVEGLIDLSFAA